MSTSLGKRARQGKVKPPKISEKVEVKWQFRSLGEIWKLEWLLTVFPQWLSRRKMKQVGKRQRTFLNAPVLTWQQGRLHDGETVLGKTGSNNSFSLEQYPLVAVQNNSAELSVHLEHS